MVTLWRLESLRQRELVEMQAQGPPFAAMPTEEHPPAVVRSIENLQRSEIAVLHTVQVMLALGLLR